MKQTSVEWLFEQLWDEPRDKFTWNTILNKAKEMQEKQIKTAYIEGYETNFYAPEEYYNKTYDKRNS
jgi:hypothetical protein